jgi:hypothetical protein
MGQSSRYKFSYVAEQTRLVDGVVSIQLTPSGVRLALAL